MAATKAASANKTRMLFIFEPVLLRWMFAGILKMLPKFEAQHQGQYRPPKVAGAHIIRVNVSPCLRSAGNGSKA
jgi:hypothetical protein